jgi:hypothetical protein
VNTQLGIMDIQNFKWDEAAAHLHKAVIELPSLYASRDCEAVYYLGVVLKLKQKWIRHMIVFIIQSGIIHGQARVIYSLLK